MWLISVSVTLRDGVKVCATTLRDNRTIVRPDSSHSRSHRPLQHEEELDKQPKYVTLWGAFIAEKVTLRYSSCDRELWRVTLTFEHDLVYLFYFIYLFIYLNGSQLHTMTKNIAGRLFGLVTKHACDGQTDRITTPKTALSIARSVKSCRHTESRLTDNALRWNAGLHQCSWVADDQTSECCQGHSDLPPPAALTTNHHNQLQTNYLQTETVTERKTRQQKT